MNIVAALLASLLALPADCASTSKGRKDWETKTGKPFAARVGDAAGINNMAEIAPGVFRGGQPTKRGLRYLKARGFKTVLSLREHHDERDMVEQVGLKSIKIPLDADANGSTPPTPAEVKSFLDIVLDPGRQPVFFHCAVGKDRTGAMAAVYRMEVDGWNSEEALEEMKAFGAHGIFKSLSKFVANYKPRHKATRAAQNPK